MNFGDYELIVGWREALLGAVVLLALYVLVAVLRLRRLRAQAAHTPEPVAIAGDMPSPDVAEPLPAFEPAGLSPYPKIELAAGERDFPWNEPPSPPSADERFAALAKELAQVRTELATVCSELATLREELRQQVERVEAAQHVAPIYGDAMQMALAGHDAATIAERCGVARAEAELVVALIRNRDDSHGGRIEPTMRDR